MTIHEAITKVDQLKPNQYTPAQKIAWLSLLDGKIFRELIANHDGGISAFDGYPEDADQETQLLVPDPWASEIYNYWLQSMIDRENGEINKYNVTSALYNGAYLDFSGWYGRNHMPKPTRTYFRF